MNSPDSVGAAVASGMGVSVGNSVGASVTVGGTVGAMVAGASSGSTAEVWSGEAAQADAPTQSRMLRRTLDLRTMDNPFNGWS